ncbi:hypothetical protein [Candidatus Rhabdochlamydia oedothoracis]|nr:hypothetical protein [Candidatus Rhabdochlamydia oedothoracis]
MTSKEQAFGCTIEAFSKSVFAVVVSAICVMHFSAIEIVFFKTN